MKLGILASHPIQYQAPLFRALAGKADVTVYFAHRQTAAGQSAAGFGVAFDWDVDLLHGYRSEFLLNVSKRPDVSSFFGCDVPEVSDRIAMERFDAFLVMGWHLKSFWQAVRACRRERIPVMVRGDSQLGTPRGKLKQLAKALGYPVILRQFDGLLFVGQRNREYLEYYKASAGQLFFAPHCVDNDFFREQAAPSSRQAARAAWGLESGRSAILFAGKLLDRKRPRDFISGMAKLRAMGKDAVAVIVGDGPLKGEVTALAAKLGVPLVMLGFRNQTELPAIYAAVDLLVLCSEASETWGLVVNEAMASGTPCVVSDACGCAPDMIVEGITGSRFETGNLDELALAMSRALPIPRQSPALAEHVARYSISQAAAGVLAAASTLSRKIGP